MNQQINSVVILGGGTAGWMTAAAFSKMLPHLNVTLIESEQIGTVGVGEATLPHLRYFNEMLGIDEREFMRETAATYKIGIDFRDWGNIGDSYIHPFGDFGVTAKEPSFYQYWLKHADEFGDLNEYSLPICMAKENKFEFPAKNFDLDSPTFSYAYHIDSAGYAKFLRHFSESGENGRSRIKRVEGKVVDVAQCSNSGDICSVTLQAGDVIEADFFIDCTGFIGLLIEKTLKAGYENWQHWLPCDRAIAAPCHSEKEWLCYSIATASDAGWRWRIPLQHRVGNGIVYSSQFQSTQDAETQLLQGMDDKPLCDLNHLRFVTGRRKTGWKNNCVAVGLSSGFLEPLESTSIYLIQLSITNLIDLFPVTNDVDILRAEYNRHMKLEYERIRDFLILHYHVTERDDTDFWRYCRTMSIPDTLATYLEQFKTKGQVPSYKMGLFVEPSWVSVCINQGIMPKAYDMRVNNMSDEQMLAYGQHLKADITKRVAAMHSHRELVETPSLCKNYSQKANSSLSLYGTRSGVSLA